jgi:hypothetical protein
LSQAFSYFLDSLISLKKEKDIKKNMGFAKLPGG